METKGKPTMPPGIWNGQGADHFAPRFRAMPFVRQGIFRFTSRNWVIFIRHYFVYFSEIDFRLSNLSDWNLKGIFVHQRFVVFL